jgi:hypothetical protein
MNEFNELMKIKLIGGNKTGHPGTTPGPPNPQLIMSIIALSLLFTRYYYLVVQAGNTNLGTWLWTAGRPRKPAQ